MKQKSGISLISKSNKLIHSTKSNVFTNLAKSNALVSLSKILFFSLFLILSGCVSMSVEQRLHRDGTYDLNFTIQTDESFAMMLQGMKQNLIVEDAVKDRFRFHETPTSISYIFRNIDPQRDSELFIDADDIEEVALEGDDFTMQADNADVSFLNPSNVELTREFRFPYYVFTYTLNFNGTIVGDDTTDSAPLFSEYIIDEENTLSEIQRQEIIEVMEAIHIASSIETVIFVTQEDNYFDVFTERMDFLNTFEFSSASADYILLTFSPEVSDVCEITSNIYFDGDLREKISSLDDEFNEICDEGSSAIVKVLTSLEEFLQTHEPEDLFAGLDAFGDQLANMFSVALYIETFGTIKETNGMQMSDTRVRFDMKEEQVMYTVVFRDFFLITLLHGEHRIYVIIISSLLSVSLWLLGIIIIIKRRKKRTVSNSTTSTIRDKLDTNVQSTESQLKNESSISSSSLSSFPSQKQDSVANDSPNQKVRAFINQSRMQGFSDEHIRETLIKTGWDENQVNSLLSKY